MIVFAAFTSHTPLLIPTIGKNHLKKIGKTHKAVHRLAEELYLSHPDVLITISQHAVNFSDVFCANLSEKYFVDFKEFGDLVTQKLFSPDLAFLDGLQRFLRKEKMPFTLNSASRLDYGSAVPLYLLTERLSIPVVPLSYSGLDAKTHFQFGKHLQEYIQKQTKRVAVIACGDLAHTLSSQSHEGYHEAGKKFDAAIRQSIADNSPLQLMKLDRLIVKEAKQCAYLPLLVLMGILEDISVRPEELSYEMPFGVGYLNAQFHLL